MTKKAEITFKDKEYRLEVAENFLQKSWGLSLRKEGKMLFKFSKPTGTKVDMMLLSKPLYLYFLNQEKEVIEAQKAEPWTWDPRTWKLYKPDKKYTYLLESFEELNLKEGDSIDIQEG